MKIKVKELPFQKVAALPRPKHIIPHKPGMLFRTLVRIVANKDLKETSFSFTCDDASRAALNGPCLVLMNHSSFIDLEIASKIMYPKPYCIVCTSDGFVGKAWLMKMLGCIPTQKFVTDLRLIKDIIFALKKRKSSVLMYPEASYTFDGCATALPRGLGRFVKMLGVPVVMIRTYGAFARDPLYNCLQKRDVKVSAAVSCLADATSVTTLSAEEIEEKLDEAFDFDNFAWQYQNKVSIDEPFRADGLERILYKCADCGAEGSMQGSGTVLSCHACGASYSLNTLGRLESVSASGEKQDETSDAGRFNPAIPRFPHIPDWYRWERECVKKELEDGTYTLDTPVEICTLVDYKCIYKVGRGRLVHNNEGFHLTGCDGLVDYVQKPQACYGLYSDYYWYELGDMICIGNRDCLYYCFPEKSGVVAKTRMAAEELYKMTRKEVRK